MYVWLIINSISSPSLENGVEDWKFQASLIMACLSGDQFLPRSPPEVTSLEQNIVITQEIPRDLRSRVREKILEQKMFLLCLSLSKL